MGQNIARVEPRNAQNKSLLLFAAAAYNVEMGISNQFFQPERNETPECQFATTPNIVTSADGTSAANALSGIQAHQSGNAFTRDASEANAVIGQFNDLPEAWKQDVLNFLSSL